MKKKLMILDLSILIISGFMHLVVVTFPYNDIYTEITSFLFVLMNEITVLFRLLFFSWHCNKHTKLTYAINIFLPENPFSSLDDVVDFSDLLSAYTIDPVINEKLPLVGWISLSHFNKAKYCI